MSTASVCSSQSEDVRRYMASHTTFSPILDFQVHEEDQEDRVSRRSNSSAARSRSNSSSSRSHSSVSSKSHSSQRQLDEVARRISNTSNTSNTSNPHPSSHHSEQCEICETPDSKIVSDVRDLSEVVLDETATLEDDISRHSVAGSSHSSHSSSSHSSHSKKSEKADDQESTAEKEHNELPKETVSISSHERKPSTPSCASSRSVASSKRSSSAATSDKLSEMVKIKSPTLSSTAVFGDIPYHLLTSTGNNARSHRIVSHDVFIATEDRSAVTLAIASNSRGIYNNCNDDLDTSRTESTTVVSARDLKTMSPPPAAAFVSMADIPNVPCTQHITTANIPNVPRTQPILQIVGCKEEHPGYTNATTHTTFTTSHIKSPVGAMCDSALKNSVITQQPVSVMRSVSGTSSRVAVVPANIINYSATPLISQNQYSAGTHHYSATPQWVDGLFTGENVGMKLLVTPEARSVHSAMSRSCKSSRKSEKSHATSRSHAEKSVTERSHTHRSHKTHTTHRSMISKTSQYGLPASTMAQGGTRDIRVKRATCCC